MKTMDDGTTWTVVLSFINSVRFLWMIRPQPSIGFSPKLTLPIVMVLSLFERRPGRVELTLARLIKSQTEQSNVFQGPSIAKIK